MRVLAIDPGPTHSAWIVVDTEAMKPLEHAIVDNGTLRVMLRGGTSYSTTRIAYLQPKHLAIEMVASYGMAVGATVFDTCLWIGRFIEAWGARFTLVYRREVKLHLCASSRAKDGNVRQALLDRWGGREKAVGYKASPGPLYGVRRDVWQALAVAVTWSETGEPNL